MYWNTVPSVDACKSTSFPAQADDKKVNVTEGPTADHCTKPPGSPSQDNQNTVEKIYSVIPETDIVCVTVGLPQNDSQSELLNQEHCIVIDDEPDDTQPRGTKRKDISGKKMKTAVSKSALHKKTRGVKRQGEKKTAMLDKNRSSERHANDSQVVIVIDDEPQEPVTQTGLKLTSSELIPDAENPSNEPGGTKRKRLRVNKQTAVSKSDGKDDIDEDPSDKTVTLDENHPKILNSSQILNSESVKADDATCIKSIDSESQQTDGDGSVSQEGSCETSELSFARRASLSEDMQAHANKKLLYVQDITADDKTNKGPNVQVCK